MIGSSAIHMAAQALAKAVDTYALDEDASDNEQEEEELSPIHAADDGTPFTPSLGPV